MCLSAIRACPRATAVHARGQTCLTSRVKTAPVFSRSISRDISRLGSSVMSSSRPNPRSGPPTRKPAGRPPDLSHEQHDQQGPAHATLSSSSLAATPVINAAQLKDILKETRKRLCDEGQHVNTDILVRATCDLLNVASLRQLGITRTDYLENLIHTEQRVINSMASYVATRQVLPSLLLSCCCSLWSAGRSSQWPFMRVAGLPAPSWPICLQQSCQLLHLPAIHHLRGPGHPAASSQRCVLQTACRPIATLWELERYLCTCSDAQVQSFDGLMLGPLHKFPCEDGCGWGLRMRALIVHTHHGPCISVITGSDVLCPASLSLRLRRHPEHLRLGPGLFTGMNKTGRQHARV